MRFAARLPISKDLADRALRSLCTCDSFVMLKIDPAGLELEVFGALTTQQALARLQAAGCEVQAIEWPMVS